MLRWEPTDSAAIKATEAAFGRFQIPRKLRSPSKLLGEPKEPWAATVRGGRAALGASWRKILAISPKDARALEAMAEALLGREAPGRSGQRTGIVLPQTGGAAAEGAPTEA